MSAFYESSLATQYKKDHGIFYTDTALAACILAFLQIPQSATILDPCCGAGSFLFCARQLGYHNVYGAELDEKAAALCRELTGCTRLYCLDTLAQRGADVLQAMGLPDGADYVVGNPPYAPLSDKNAIKTDDTGFLRSVRASGGNLFVAALYRAFELTKPQGIISYIVPKNLLHVSSYGALRRKLLQEKQILSIVDIGARFKSVRGEQIILTLRNCSTPGGTIALYRRQGDDFVKTAEVPQAFYIDEILLFSHPDDLDIYARLNGPSYQKLGNVYRNRVRRGKSEAPDAVPGRQIRKFGFKDRPVPQAGCQIFMQNIYSRESGVIASFGGSLPAAQTVTVITDGDESQCRALTGFLHSRLCNYYLVRFCYNNSTLTMHTDAKYLYRLPLANSLLQSPALIQLVRELETVEYQSALWFQRVDALNQLVYQIYEMRERETEYIDSEMRALQSQRWNKNE